MPRAIIDTQSSRPGYIRRQVLTFAIAVLALAVVVIVGWLAWHAWLAPQNLHVLVPGKSR